MTDTRPAMKQQLAEVAELGMAELRDEWMALFGRPAPRLSRNLLARAVTHRIQEKAFGRLRPAAARRLRRLAGGIDGGGANGPSAGPALKPGTRLLREWRGETQVVEVTHEGLVWKGNRYRSLSAVARAITGVRWSGPRFFGLTHQR